MTYDEIKAVNWSSLKHMATSPLEYRWRVDHPETRKPAWVLGSAVHTLVLEPAKFDSRFAVFEGTRRGKAWDEWLDAHPGIESLKPDELEQARAIADAIMGHRDASKLIKACRFEEVTTWTDEVTGLACKGRIDAIGPTVIVDLKTSRDIAPRSFSRAVGQYLYHGQLAFYCDGAIAAGKLSADHDPPAIIAAQSGAPYDVAVYELSEDALTQGRLLYRSLLTRLVACHASGLWPGVAPDRMVLDLPRWIPGIDPDQEEDF